MGAAGFLGGLAGGLATGRALKNLRSGGNKDTAVPQAAMTPLPEGEEGPVIPSTLQRVPTKRKGGRIKKTGIYQLHKGEFVVKAEDVKRMDKKRKASRKSGRKSGR